MSTAIQSEVDQVEQVRFHPLDPLCERGSVIHATDSQPIACLSLLLLQPLRLVVRAESDSSPRTHLSATMANDPSREAKPDDSATAILRPKKS